MQPWNYHKNFIFHQMFDDMGDIQICDEIGDFQRYVILDQERASLTQATNVPWTLELKAPENPIEFSVTGNINSPDTCSPSKVNCATPLYIDVQTSCGHCGVLKYNVELTQI